MRVLCILLRTRCWRSWTIRVRSLTFLGIFFPTQSSTRQRLTRNSSRVPSRSESCTCGAWLTLTSTRPSCFSSESVNTRRTSCSWILRKRLPCWAIWLQIRSSENDKETSPAPLWCTLWRVWKKRRWKKSPASSTTGKCYYSRWGRRRMTHVS